MNYYSKRTLLGGVYASTLLVWLDDVSEDLHITRAFLDRRIEVARRVHRIDRLQQQRQPVRLGLPRRFAQVGDEGCARRF